MKRIFLALALLAATAFAEPTFDQMQDLIAQKNFAAAEQGLEVIIKNHPNSAKAFYSMAQAQAGLGHLDKAQFALDHAKGLDPTLGFASSSNVEALQVAITPQATKIEKVSSGSTWFWIFLTIVGVLCISFAITVYRTRRKPDDKPFGGHIPPKPIPPAPSPSDRAYMRDHNLIDNVPPARSANAYGNTYTPPPAPRYSAPTYVAPQPVVVNNSGNDMLTGVLIGNMLSSSHHDNYDHTRIVEREVVREVPAPRETYTPPAKSSSWDDDSSSRKSSSSSWSSSSDSSSSWSSSSSDSSSSWDSSSSSSSSSWD